MTSYGQTAGADRAVTAGGESAQRHSGSASPNAHWGEPLKVSNLKLTFVAMVAAVLLFVPARAVQPIVVAPVDELVAPVDRRQAMTQVPCKPPRLAPNVAVSGDARCSK